MSNKDTQFKPGNKLGKGRPKGARNKLTKAYLQDLYEIYSEGGKGKEALKRAMEERSDGFIKLIAQLVPKDFDVKNSGDVTVKIVQYGDLDKEE